MKLTIQHILTSLEVPWNFPGEHARPCFEKGHTLMPHTSGLQKSATMRMGGHKKRRIIISVRESLLFLISDFFFSNFYPTLHCSYGDLSYLLFHCHPRGLSVCYYLFFSSPASSLPSHFLSLMILLCPSCLFLMKWECEHNVTSWSHF